MGAGSVRLHPFWRQAHQVLGCLQWVLRSSEKLCPQWAFKIESWMYRIITPVFLSAFITLDFLTLRYSKFLSLHTLLFVGLAALMLVYLKYSAAYQAWQNGFCITSAAILVLYAWEWLVPKWMGFLQETAKTQKAIDEAKMTLSEVEPGISLKLHRLCAHRSLTRCRACNITRWRIEQKEMSS